MPLGTRRETSEACACDEKTGGGEAMLAASLMILDAGNTSVEEGPVWEAPVGRVWR